MKKFNKVSLVIAPMALMLFSSSLNIPKVMADDNGSWSEQARNEQNKQDMDNFLNTYDNKSIEKIAADTEQKLYNFLNDVSNYVDNNYTKEINDQINNTKDVNEQNKLKDKLKEAQSNSTIFKKYAQNANDTYKKLNYKYNKINNQDIKIDGNSNNSNEFYKDILKVREDLNFVDSKVRFSAGIWMNSKLPNNIEVNLDKISESKELSNIETNLRQIINNFQFNKREQDFKEQEEKAKQIEKEHNNDNSNNESMDLGAEIIKLKNQLNNINNTPSNYVPVSNNSNVNNNNDALKNELNNAKNNINNIINKNVELSNTTNSLKNEIETLKQQVHELKNNKKSKHKNTKANKRALNKKKKELNKVNKELKKHIRKSNKKKLLQKRNSILKSIKKLNK